MPEPPLRLAEVVVLVVVTILWPLYDLLLGWPRFCRQVTEGKPGARASTYREATIVQWAFVGAFVAAWSASDRQWGTPALSLPTGPQFWGSACLIAGIVVLQIHQLRTLSQRPTARAALLKKISSMPFLQLIPRDKHELAWMYPLCVTAGFCEELLYRGFVVWGLSIPLGWWAATAASVLSFGLIHAYQGTSGIVRTAATGLMMTALVAVTRSLWPAMVLHAVIDVGSVTLLYTALRDHPIVSVA
jgi:membrane protease YdiL (CAAX protease family)